MTTKSGTVRVAAVGDIHLGGKGLDPPLQILFGQVAEHADVLALCGDLTDRGDPEEARLMAKALTAVTVPIVAVLGNHDYESGKEQEVARILCDAGVHVLDGDAHEVLGVGFAGIKGFAGGFGRRALGPWGEGLIKQFVREALDEALKLETALGQLRTERRVALLHYSPIAATVVGEPLEIYPYLGSSRLEEPLTRYPVDVVFHGHAHHGSPEGRTMTDVPVYNVSMVLLQENFPDRPPFRVVELPVGQASADRQETPGGTPLRRATDRPVSKE
ncbi:MAG: metallophosphoesterase [Gemmatimonadales bacterium]|nr:metallophosphoesterase [Gemmatimonadales bacterium]